ncbi:MULTISPECIES: hypothetical protein [unclassified Streptomyces]|uniref:hypothetical protein n=1 Tax=unclassified Streptomyces TaxID=2593676 RepID=UPI0035DF7508
MPGVVTDDGSTQPGWLIDGIVREGARRTPNAERRTPNASRRPSRRKQKPTGTWPDCRPSSKERLGRAYSCVLALLGVHLDGTEELIAPAEGLRPGGREHFGERPPRARGTVAVMSPGSHVARRRRSVRAHDSRTAS